MGFAHLKSDLRIPPLTLRGPCCLEIFTLYHEPYTIAALLRWEGLVITTSVAKKQVPLWMPSLLVQLAEFIGEPQPISSTVEQVRCLSEVEMVVLNGVK